MTLVRWQPAVGSGSDFDRLFDGFFSGSRSAHGVSRRWVPAMDLAETEDSLVLTADLPGLSEEDIEIEVKDGVLAVSGERRDDRKQEGKGYRRIERSYGRFSRALRLPRGTDPEQVSASFDRGVLEVRIAKPEERKPHRIEIEGATAAAATTIEAEASEADGQD